MSGDAAGIVPTTWPAVIHRLAATALGLFILVIGLIALRNRKLPGQSVAVPLALFALMLFLAGLGFRTPSAMLPMITMGNLLGGMVMLALLWWLSQRARPPPSIFGKTNVSIRPWAVLGMIIVVSQIALGGWVSANFAALSCPTLPGCNEVSWLSTTLREAFDPFRELDVDQGGKVVPAPYLQAIHMAHRFGAVITAVYLGGLGIWAFSAGDRYRTTGMAILVLLGLQIGLGVSAVVFSLPLLLVTAHNGVAALLLLSVVDLHHLSHTESLL